MNYWTGIVHCSLFLAKIKELENNLLPFKMTIPRTKIHLWGNRQSNHQNNPMANRVITKIIQRLTELLQLPYEPQIQQTHSVIFTRRLCNLGCFIRIYCYSFEPSAYWRWYEILSLINWYLINKLTLNYSSLICAWSLK